jgi:predicted amidohydrolase
MPRKARRVDGRLRVAVCQYDSRPGEYRWNVDHALRYAEEAADDGAGVIVLPEYSFCTVADTVEGRAFFEMRHAMRWLKPRLSRFCRRHRCYLFANIPFEPRGSDPLNPWRRNRTLVFDPRGRVVATYDKRLAAALDIFCHVGEGEGQPALDLDFGRVGLMICKDTSEPRRFKKLYRGVNLIVAQFGHITDWTISTNDPPWLSNDMATVGEDFPEIGRELGSRFQCPAVFANKTGLEPVGVFTGGSCAVAPDGEIVSSADFGGGILYVDFELDENGRIVRDAAPIPVEIPSES